MGDLRGRLIKLAYHNPELRAELLPLLKQGAKVPKIKGAEKELVAEKFKDEIGAYKQKIKDAEAEEKKARGIMSGLSSAHDVLRWNLKGKGAPREAMTALMGLGDSLKEEIPEIYDKLKQPWEDYKAATGSKADKNHALDQVYKAFKTIPEDTTQKIHDWYNKSEDVTGEASGVRNVLNWATEGVNEMFKYGLISKDQKKQFKKDFEIDQQGTRAAFNREMKGERVEYKGKRMNFTSLPKDERQRIFEEDWLPEKKKELQVLHDEKGASAKAKAEQKKKEQSETAKARREQKKQEQAEQERRNKPKKEAPEPPAKKNDKDLLKTKVPNPSKAPGAAKEVTLNTVKKQEQEGKAPKGIFKKWWDKLTGKKASSGDLRASVIKLAYENPKLRAELLPLLKSSKED